jgi:hypothetical protein
MPRRCEEQNEEVSAMSTDPTKITQLYAQIPLEAMQQVNDSYMAWYVDRVTRELDEKIANLRAELRENDAHEASFRPSPSELNAIERLQRSGVTSVDLLDRMVEQGEEWLMLTMRRLDHFERTGLAPKDYSIWCEHALGGAYDWIDHDRIASGAPPVQSAGRGPTSGPMANRTPDWNANSVPSAAPLPQQSPSAPQHEDRPTQPVPSVAPRWGETSYPGVNTGGMSGAPGAPGSTGDPNSESGRRNIFRIFTN